MYQLSDGEFLGSVALKGKPTHLAMWNGGLWVSAGPRLFWGQISGASLSLHQVSVAMPSGTQKIGGVSFDDSTSTVFVIFQSGTGGTGSGKIETFKFAQESPSAVPTLSGACNFTTIKNDTPEFVLFIPD